MNAISISIDIAPHPYRKELIDELEITIRITAPNIGIMERKKRYRKLETAIPNLFRWGSK